MSKTGGAALQKDVPWRASNAPKPIPRIHHSPLLRVPQNPYSDFALFVMKQTNPIGNGLGKEAIVEAVLCRGRPHQSNYWALSQVWPIDIDLKFIEPVGRELKSIGKFMDSAVDLMNKSFIDR